VVAVPDRALVDGWAADLVPLPVEHVPIAGARPPAALDRTEARRHLDLPPDRFVLLLLGASHPEKDLAVVVEGMDLLVDAAAGDDVPLLVVAGQCAEDLPPDLRAAPPRWLQVRPGTFDDRTRTLLPVAADAVVLSFVGGYRRNSGTLMDAVTAGTAVIVSDRSSAAEEVERLGIGVPFEAGDPESFAHAVGALQRTGPALDADAAAAARDALSNREVARRHLEAVGLAPRPSTTPAGAGAPTPP
jgi:glycosyltransferase involved in cell wall biosynthesis